MNELVKRIMWCLIGIIIGLFIASNIWMHYRVSNVEATNMQIVQFLNQAQQKQATPPMEVKPIPNMPSK
jgi:uncharacterized membrane protein YciS (DUF1049 family)